MLIERVEHKATMAYSLVSLYDAADIPFVQVPCYLFRLNCTEAKCQLHSQGCVSTMSTNIL